jgi:hypothetical protein
MNIRIVILVSIILVALFLGNTRGYFQESLEGCQLADYTPDSSKPSTTPIKSTNKN